MPHIMDRTRRAFRFEAWVSANIDCPLCGARALHEGKRNMAHIDLVCMVCGAGISVKRHAVAPKATESFRAPPAASAGYRAAMALWTAERLFVLAGNERTYRFYPYRNHKVIEIAPRRTQIEGRVILKFPPVGAGG